MKNLNSNPYQRNIQTSQDQRNLKSERLERMQRMRQNLKLNSNHQQQTLTQHHRKHNSPDANKLRIYQQQQNQFHSQHQQLGRNIRAKKVDDQDRSRQGRQQKQREKKYQRNNKESQNIQNNLTRPLTKTASSPKLLPSQQQKQRQRQNRPKQQLYTQSNQYQKLHQKLNSIEDKIMSMKKNIQRKREQKQKLLQKQKRQRLQHQRQKERRAQSEQKPAVVGLKGLVTQVPEHKQLHTFEKNPYSPRHNIYYVSEVVRAYLDQKSLAREHIVTSLHILRILQKVQMPSNQVMFARQQKLQKKKSKQNMKTVVFDLDQTLIHCNDSLTPPHDVKLPIKFPTGEIIEAGINIRPYARQILRNLSKNFQVIVFTASHSCYANVVIDYLDPNRQFVEHRLFREHCYQSPEGMYIKDLRVINRDLKDLVLVDNAAYSYAFQLDNGIPILPYYHGTQDYQLNTLQKYLNTMLLTDDVRKVNQKTFFLQHYKNYYNQPQRMVEQLYLNQEIQSHQKKGQGKR